ncbi:hypothetical protein GJ496_005295 [Pomphorhynchus laevis]|nr:hypothetical protein GJ496_005295 [Pomphorhynchus laevis]
MNKCTRPRCKVVHVLTIQEVAKEPISRLSEKLTHWLKHDDKNYMTNQVVNTIEDPKIVYTNFIGTSLNFNMNAATWIGALVGSTALSLVGIFPALCINLYTKLAINAIAFSNLLANFIDNFVHGMGIAGGYIISTRLLTSLSAPIGAVFGLIINHSDKTGSIKLFLLGFVSGAFVHVSMISILADLLNETNTRFVSND